VAVGVVGAAGVGEDLADLVKDADLDGGLRVVEADEDWYRGCHFGLLQMGRRMLGYSIVPPARGRREQPGIIPI
jgi:hypothetical protein